jgi:hypothetical protein
MKRCILFFIVVTVLAIGILGLLTCSNQPGTVEGTVTYAESGQPVAGAEIVVFELESAEKVPQLDAYTKGDVYLKQTADELGVYSISLKKGNYIVEVWTQGHQVGNHMIKMKSNKVTTIDFSVTIPAP